MKTKTMKLTGILFTIVMLITMLGAFTLTTSAAAPDLPVNSTTLKDNDGDGYYDIGSLAELDAFRIAVVDIDNTINGELTDNIDAKYASGWGSFPIGTSGTPYNGTFIGHYYRISGLSSSPLSGTLGLFGVIGERGVVKEVGLVSFSFGNFDVNRVGGIAGECYGTIQNCYVTDGTINVTTYGGGITGILYAGGKVEKFLKRYGLNK